MADEIEYAHVKAHPRMGEQVALSEMHSDHPGGQAWVAGQNQAPQKVALTPTVQEALIDSQHAPSTLIRLEGAALRKAEDAFEERQAKKAELRQRTIAQRAMGSPVELQLMEVRAELARLRAGGNIENVGPALDSLPPLPGQDASFVRPAFHDAVGGGQSAAAEAPPRATTEETTKPATTRSRTTTTRSRARK